MKTELWNGNAIRFVEVNNEWWAVAKDVADALEYSNTSNMVKLVPDKYLKHSVLEGMNAKSLLMSEFGIYKAVFGSHKPEATDFQEWVFTIIKQLREASGLEGFEIFRQLDKEHQKQEMATLSHALAEPKRVSFIKANTIANKATSLKYGYSKMLKKADMTPAMLVTRQPILDDTVELMAVKDKFGLTVHVSSEIYKKHLLDA